MHDSLPPTGSPSSLDRRRFLALLGAAGASGVLGGCRDRSVAGGASPDTSAAPDATAGAGPSVVPPSSTSVPTSAPAAPSGTGDRVLVVVQLSGGNDGLNTLVPLDGRYHDLRPTIGLADDTLIAAPGTSAYGLHPALAPLAPLLTAGHVAALEAIGYPSPDRSHFAALDDWWSATPGRASTSGWLGRWLDATAGDDDDPLRAVALGAGVPALTGERTRPAVVLTPAAFAFHAQRLGGDVLAQLTGPGGGGVAGTGSLDTVYRAAVARAVAAADAFGAATTPAPTATADRSPDEAQDEAAGGALTDALATAARLVTNHRPTRILHIAAGGFDTHAAQIATHRALLADLATGVRRFFDDLATSGDADRVLLVTVSEFGRRAYENGSGGTDHGKAGMQFVMGPAVTGGVYGQADLGRLDDGDLAPSLDVRSLYTMALDWLGASVEQVLDRRYDTLGVLGR